jgi:hypothetical protein
MHVLQKLSPSSSRVYLGGSCPPNAIPTFNQLNAIRNIQMIFVNKANPLRSREFAIPSSSILKCN